MHQSKDYNTDNKDNPFVIIGTDQMARSNIQFSLLLFSIIDTLNANGMYQSLFVEK